MVAWMLVSRGWSSRTKQDPCLYHKGIQSGLNACERYDKVKHVGQATARPSPTLLDKVTA